MPPLPVLRCREVVVSFLRSGWTISRRRGSRIIWMKEGSMATLAVPAHKELAAGALRSLVRAAEITTREFLDACERQ